MELKTTCETESCPNKGIEVTLELPADFSTDVTCACGNLCTNKEK